jgi:hypothetical protein
LAGAFLCANYNYQSPIFASNRPTRSRDYRGTLTGVDDLTLTVDAPSKPPLRLWRTRIAVSVFFGVLTVLLCLMWMRSFWRYDYVSHEQVDYTICVSNNGYLEFRRSRSRWFSSNKPIDATWTMGSTSANGRFFQHLFWQDQRFTSYILPYSYLVFATAIGAALPWLLSSRFSLRAMLIATTLVAILLALGVWLAS